MEFSAHMAQTFACLFLFPNSWLFIVEQPPVDTLDSGLGCTFSFFISNCLFYIYVYILYICIFLKIATRVWSGTGLRSVKSWKNFSGMRDPAPTGALVGCRERTKRCRS